MGYRHVSKGILQQVVLSLICHRRRLDRLWLYNWYLNLLFGKVLLPQVPVKILVVLVRAFID